jgi:hypothetical protein
MDSGGVVGRTAAAKENKYTYPIGTLVYYGPDDQTVTKIVASVIPQEGADMISKRWYGDGVVQDTQVIAELGRFFKSHQVQKVLMTGSVAGCPHEAGLDYPEGEECPHCPYWSEVLHSEEEG